MSSQGIEPYPPRRSHSLAVFRRETLSPLPPSLPQYVATQQQMFLQSFQGLSQATVTQHELLAKVRHANGPCAPTDAPTIRDQTRRRTGRRESFFGTCRSPRKRSCQSNFSRTQMQRRWHDRTLCNRVVSSVTRKRGESHLPRSKAVAHCCALNVRRCLRASCTVVLDHDAPRRSCAL